MDEQAKIKLLEEIEKSARDYKVDVGMIDEMEISTECDRLGIHIDAGDSPEKRKTKRDNQIVWDPIKDVGDHHYPPQWLVPNAIPVGDVTLMTGSGGLGKSTFMSGLCLATATPQSKRDAYNAPVRGPLDLHINEAHRGKGVAFISYEDSAERLLYRARGWAHSQFLDEAEGWGFLAQKDGSSSFRIYQDRGGAPIWGKSADGEPAFTAAGLARLAAIGATNPRLLVIDPLAAAFTGNENDRSEVQQFLGTLNRWAQHHEAAVVIIAHPPKATGVLASGSTQWVNGVRSHINLHRCRVVTKQKSDSIEYKLDEVSAGILRDSHSLESGEATLLEAAKAGRRVGILSIEKLNDAIPMRPIMVEMIANHSKETHGVFELETAERMVRNMGWTHFGSAPSIADAVSAFGGAERPKPMAIPDPIDDYPDFD